MKFEITVPQLGNCVAPDIIVPISEFKKAEKDKNEYVNLRYMLESLSNMASIQFELTEDIYQELRKQLPKSGDIVFAATSDNPDRRRPNIWYEIFAVNKNEITRLEY